MSGVEWALLTAFWLPAILLFHNYFLFGVSIALLARLKSPREFAPQRLPSLTVIIPARNEEKVIRRTLEAILAQDYRAAPVDIVVGSDVSTDGTDSIVGEFAGLGVTLAAFRERQGKLGILDALIPAASGEVVVVIDANVQPAPNTLSKLAARYSDPAVGAVSAFQTVELPGSKTSLREESSYRNAEARLKERLGKLGTLVGAFGGCYSLRKECFRPIGAIPMADDVILPLEVLGQRRRVEFAADAVAYEEIGSSIGAEFRRRIRMTAYNLNCLGRAFRLGWRGGALAFYTVVSYKILRWFTPFLLLIPLIAAGLLVAASDVRYPAYIAAAGVGSTLLGAAGAILSVRLPFFSSIYYFVVMNVAVLLGFFRWMRGVERFWGAPPR